MRRSAFGGAGGDGRPKGKMKWCGVGSTGTLRIRASR